MYVSTPRARGFPPHQKGRNMVRVWSYVKNRTDESQSYKSWRLANGIVSCIPDGILLVQGRTVTVPPRGILKVPTPEWADTLRRQPWAEEVPEEEALALVEMLNAPAHVPEIEDVPEPEIAEVQETPPQKRRTPRKRKAN